MSLAVDHHAAHTANPFAAIVIECDGIFALGNKALVDDVEHFQKGHVLADVGGIVADHAAGIRGIFLSPDVKGEFHL